MICVSIAENTVERCLSSLEGIDFAEIRLDALKTDRAGVQSVFSRHRRLIATCRPREKSEEERKTLLITAIEAGAAYVDIEVESNDGYRKTIVRKAISNRCCVIMSYHNYQKTPSMEKLKQYVNLCFDSGAEIAKIACTSHSPRENARLLGLLQEDRPVIPVGMGKKGAITRIVAPFLGSPFTYASRALGRETAPGQLDYVKLKNIMETLNHA